MATEPGFGRERFVGDSPGRDQDPIRPTGAARNPACGGGACASTARAAWIAFGNKGDLGIVGEGDRRLFNP
jgi:hypothetical protein